MKDKKKIALSIKSEIFFISFISLVCVSLLIAGISLGIVYKNNMGNAKSLLRECNSQIVTYTERMFHDNAALVKLMAEDELVINAGEGNAEGLIEYFDFIHANNSNMTYVYAGYSDGTLIISDYDTPLHYDPTTRPWYQAAAGTEGVARLVYKDAATNEWLFSQCVKLTDSEGNMTGVVAIDCANDNIVGELSKKYQYESQWSFIADSNGTVLIHPQENLINASVLEWVDSSIWDSIVCGQKNYAEYTKDGIRSIAYFERIPKTNFIVVTAIARTEIVHPIVKNMLIFLTFILFISVVLGIFLSRIMVSRIAKPIMDLGEQIENLAAGNLELARDTRYSNEEIKGIAENIDMIVRGITDREEQRKIAEYYGYHDSMTDLYNRRYFEDKLVLLDRQENYPISIICCDINGLKLTNDVFGHGIGDRLILKIAECLRKGFGGDDIFARVGGDEFAIALPNTSLSQVETIVEQLKKSFPEEDIGGAVVSASLGYAVKTESQQVMEDVIKAADEMMYTEKSVESIAMKRKTMKNIIAASEKEGFVKALTEEEESLLNTFSDIFCPGLKEVLHDSYRLREIGRCSLILQNKENQEFANTHMAEMSYRILSAFEDYHSVGGYVLHFMERWDGSGEPAGLSGRDIPLPSRIIAVVEGYFNDEIGEKVFEKKGIWYDPKLIDALKTITGTILMI